MYKNSKYKVDLPEGGTKYQVTNLETGVVEFEESSLPKCIIVAVESEAALERLLPVKVSEVLRFPINQREAEDAADTGSSR